MLRSTLLMMIVFTSACTGAKSNMIPEPTTVKMSGNGTARMPPIASTEVLVDFPGQTITLKNGLDRPIGVRITQVGSDGNGSNFTLYEDEFIAAHDSIAENNIRLQRDATYNVEVKVYKEGTTPNRANLDNGAMIEAVDMKQIKFKS